MSLSVPPRVAIVSVLTFKRIARDFGEALLADCREEGRHKWRSKDQMIGLLTREWSTFTLPINGIAFGVTRLITPRQVRSEMLRLRRRW